MNLPQPRKQNSLPKPYCQDEWVTIYHGNCMDLIPSIGKVDLFISDPPYIIAAGGGGIASKREYLRDKIQNKIDSGFDDSVLDLFENWFCFCGKQQLRKLIDKADDSGDKWMLINCFKDSPPPLTKLNYLPDTEYVIHKFKTGRLFGEYKDKSRFIKFPNERGEFSHPTVKPLALMTKLVNLGSKENDLLFDPFCGTGSTLLAAKQLKRRCIGIEIEEKWCEVAAQRLSQNFLL